MTCQPPFMFDRVIAVSFSPRPPLSSSIDPDDAFVVWFKAKLLLFSRLCLISSAQWIPFPVSSLQLHFAFESWFSLFPFAVSCKSKCTSAHFERLSTSKTLTTSFNSPSKQCRSRIAYVLIVSIVCVENAKNFVACYILFSDSMTWLEDKEVFNWFQLLLLKFKCFPYTMSFWGTRITLMFFEHILIATTSWIACRAYGSNSSSVAVYLSAVFESEPHDTQYSDHAGSSSSSLILEFAQ